MLVRTNRFARHFRTVALTLAAAALGATAVYGQKLPPDASSTCVVQPGTFASWFDTGHPSLNGSVKPADSITFSTNPNCDFYAWSHQMFLWLTSPAPSLYGGKGRIFNSPVFYDVSVSVNGQRHFIPHLQRPLPFPLGTGKVGMDGLPVVIDRKGLPHEVLEAARAANGNVAIAVGGKTVELKAVTAGPGGKALLTDRAGKTVNAPVSLNASLIPHGLIAPQSRLLLQGGMNLKTDAARTNFALARLAKANVLVRFPFGSNPVFVNPLNNLVVDVEPGQAGGNDVLLAQNGSIIFYQTTVNDMYAYFLTGQNHGKLPVSNQFPINGPMADAIVKYAATNGVQNRIIPDRIALAIEVKMSWIEVTPALPNPGSYITIQANIPVYNTTNPKSWPAVTQKTTTLALLGMHVVGSTVGHPEMLWATFEHYGNTPLATYQYNNSGGTQTVTQSTAPGPWLFSATGSTGPFNQAHAVFTPASGTLSPVINAPAPPPPPLPSPGFNISPSDTLRQAPFGTPYNQTPPNPVDATPAAANTEVISLNNNVAAQMAAAGAAGDVRNNYFQSGTTWTIGGAAPTGQFGTTGVITPGVAGNEVGTNYLTNSTMETYQQSPNNMIGGTNCFSCHQSNTVSVSHIYNSLQPLF